MNIPGLVNYLLNEDGMEALENEDGETLDIDTPTTNYNIKYLFNGSPVLATMDIPDEIDNPDDQVEFVRLSLLAYYQTLCENEQPENIFSVQVYTADDAPLQNPNYSQPGWPYEYFGYDKTY